MLLASSDRVRLAGFEDCIAGVGVGLATISLTDVRGSGLEQLTRVSGAVSMFEESTAHGPYPWSVEWSECSEAWSDTIRN